MRGSGATGGVAAGYSLFEDEPSKGKAKHVTKRRRGQSTTVLALQSGSSKQAFVNPMASNASLQSITQSAGDDGGGVQGWCTQDCQESVAAEEGRIGDGKAKTLEVMCVELMEKAQKQQVVNKQLEAELVSRQKLEKQCAQGHGA